MPIESHAKGIEMDEYTPEQIEAMECEAAMNNLAADEWDENE